MNQSVKLSKILNLKYPIVLASQSPRRRKLLNQLGLEFDVIPADIDENISLDIEPEQYVKTLAWGKAKHVAANLSDGTLVIGADTIVVLDGKILNKPGSDAEAEEMLKSLSGHTHFVYTGIALVVSGNMTSRTNVCKTAVSFRTLDDVEIKAYVQSGSPMDKAGAYGIQDDFGAVFVRHIDGCYYNIVGLPLEMLFTELKAFCDE